MLVVCSAQMNGEKNMILAVDTVILLLREVAYILQLLQVLFNIAPITNRHWRYSESVRRSMQNGIRIGEDEDSNINFLF